MNDGGSSWRVLHQARSVTIDPMGTGRVPETIIRRGVGQDATVLAVRTDVANHERSDASLAL